MIAARVETSNIAASFRELARARGRPLSGVMRQSGRRIAVRLTRMTQPFGFDDGAKSAGEGAVKRDVSLVFNTPSMLYAEIKGKSEGAARGFWKAVQEGDADAAARVLASVGMDRTILDSPDAQAHKAARNNRGRVARSMANRLLVLVPEKVQEYAAEIVKRVGITAAGWAECAKQLGGYRGLVSGESIPRWKRAGGRRHGGRAWIANPERDPQVTMENGVPWLTQACPESTMQRAINDDMATVARELDRALQHELRRTGLARF